MTTTPVLLALLLLASGAHAVFPLWATQAPEYEGRLESDNSLLNVVSGFGNTAVQVWNVDTLTVTKTLFSTAEVDDAAVANGKVVIYTDRSPSSFLTIDLTTGATKKLPLNLAGVSNSFLSPDGSKIITMSDSNGRQKLNLFNSTTGALLSTSYVSEDLGLALSYDANLFALGNNSGVFLVSTATGNVLTTMEWPCLNSSYSDQAFMFSADGLYLFAIDFYTPQSVCKWSVKTGKISSRFRAPSAEIEAVSPDGNYFAFVENENPVLHVLDTRTGGEVFHTNISRTYDDITMDFTRDSKQIVVFNENLIIIDFLQGSLRTTPLLSLNAGKISYSSKGDAIATLSESIAVTLDAKTGKVLKSFVGHTEEILDVAFSPSGDVLASGSADDTVRVWNALTGAIIRVLTCRGDMHAVRFSPNGKLLAATGEDGSLRLWDTSTWSSVKVISASSSLQAALAFSPDGSLLACAGLDGVISLWDVSTGSKKASWTGADTSVSSLSFSPDGTNLVSSSRTSIILWDVSSGTQISKIHSIQEYGNAAFSPDGEHIAVADGSLYFYDAATGSLQASFPANAATLAFSPDGTKIATSNQVLSLWEVTV